MIKAKFVAALSLSVLIAGAGALAQDASQNSRAQQTAPPKKPKVWTNDNIGAVRTSADQYTDGEQAEAATAVAAHEAAAQAAKAEAEAAPPKQTPKTVQQADQMIAQEQSQIASQQQYVDQVKKDLPTVPDAERTRLQWRIESRSQYVDRMRGDLSDLEKERAALAKQDSGKSSAQDTPSETSADPTAK